MRRRVLLPFAAALLALAMLILAQFTHRAIPTGSWGLSFQAEGQAPQGPVGVDLLAQYDAVYVGNTDKKVIYLTFDAGYENGCTAKILDTLKAHKVSAAFFLVGDYMERNPDLVRRMVDEGHIVGNHTMNHPNMSGMTGEAFQKEITGLEALFREITGRELPKFYRPPQGLYSEENLKAARELGYRTVFWSLAYVDWKNDSQPTADYAFSKLLPRTHNGAVVLLHSTSKTNAAILDQLLTRWEDMGYRFGTLEELFDQSGKLLQP